MKLDIMSRKKALFAVFEDFCHAPFSALRSVAGLRLGQARAVSPECSSPTQQVSSSAKRRSSSSKVSG
jgi:hypothetical protein